MPDLFWPLGQIRITASTVTTWRTAWSTTTGTTAARRTSTSAGAARWAVSESLGQRFNFLS